MAEESVHVSKPICAEIYLSISTAVERIPPAPAKVDKSQFSTSIPPLCPLARFSFILEVKWIRVASIPKGCVMEDRKSTRLNSSHVRISYAVFCLKKKK